MFRLALTAHTACASWQLPHPPFSASPLFPHLRPVLELHGRVDGLDALVEGVGHVGRQPDGDAVQQVLTQRALLRVVRGDQQGAAAEGAGGRDGGMRKARGNWKNGGAEVAAKEEAGAEGKQRASVLTQ